MLADPSRKDSRGFTDVFSIAVLVLALDVVDDHRPVSDILDSVFERKQLPDVHGRLECHVEFDLWKIALYQVLKAMRKFIT